MLIIDYIREKVKEFLGIQHIHKNPNDVNFQYISDEEILRISKAKEFKLWYLGEGDKIEQYYLLGESARKGLSDRNYFWSIATREAMVKKVHSGIPNSIITTLVNVVGEHKITSDDKELEGIIYDMLEDNDFIRMVNQEQLPLTLAQGWGAYKINIDEAYEYPLIEYYEAENVRFIGKNRRIEGIIYLDYYELNNKKYVLFETRSIKQKTENVEAGSYVEYNLFELKENNNILPVELSTIKELSMLETIFIPGYMKILGVPTRIFHDPSDVNYGRSILTGKIDLFDDLDQALSQASQTVKVSTPVEYYPVSVLEKNAYGVPMLPVAYNRQFIKKPASIPSGDGVVGSDTIQTSQPQLNFEQYAYEVKNKLDLILTGILSPATMGIDVAKKDNAEAQREKEKITLMTRNNIINAQRKIIQDVIDVALDLFMYKNGQPISDERADFSVIYNDFANPSFESKLQFLSPAYSGGAISTEKYVETLWGEMMSDEEQKEEVERLNKIRNADNLTPEDFDGTGITDDSVEEEVFNEPLDVSQE